MKKMCVATYLMMTALSLGVGVVDPASAAPTASDKQTDPAAIKKAEVNQPAPTGQPGTIDSPPIHGWHPIKRALQPVVALEKNGVHLEQQIMKMDGPITGLHPPMVRLDHKATAVSANMDKMQGQMGHVTKQVEGVRSDLEKMQKDIADIKGPIISVRQPLMDIQKPIAGVKQQLNNVLMAIAFAGFGITIGLPLMSIVVYRFRDKLFPADVAEAANLDHAAQDFNAPVETAENSPAASDATTGDATVDPAKDENPATLSV